MLVWHLLGTPGLRQCFPIMSAEKEATNAEKVEIDYDSPDLGNGSLMGTRKM